jgi:Uma2 family endonuclease
MVREPPAPLCPHQAVVTRTLVLLAVHVRMRGLGHVLVAPTDVVLDEAKALVVQPDLLFVSRERAAIVRDRVWGAPDLVVEVESPGTVRRDRTTKLRWYRTYGVRECWLVDPIRQAVTVVIFRGEARPLRRRHAGAQVVRSEVLPGFGVTAEEFFLVFI